MSEYVAVCGNKYLLFTAIHNLKLFLDEKLCQSRLYFLIIFRCSKRLKTADISNTQGRGNTPHIDRKGISTTQGRGVPLL